MLVDLTPLLLAQIYRGLSFIRLVDLVNHVKKKKTFSPVTTGSYNNNNCFCFLFRPCRQGNLEINKTNFDF